MILLILYINFITRLLTLGLVQLLSHGVNLLLKLIIPLNLLFQLFHQIYLFFPQFFYLIQCFSLYLLYHLDQVVAQLLAWEALVVISIVKVFAQCGVVKLGLFRICVHVNIIVIIIDINKPRTTTPLWSVITTTCITIDIIVIVIHIHLTIILSLLLRPWVKINRTLLLCLHNGVVDTKILCLLWWLATVW